MENYPEIQNSLLFQPARVRIFLYSNHPIGDTVNNDRTEHRIERSGDIYGYICESGEYGVQRSSKFHDFECSLRERNMSSLPT